jgi:hypothetical protein
MANSARIAVFTGDMEYISARGGNPGRCATLRVPGNKQTLLCMKWTIMAEVAAAALNFTRVYTYDRVNRSGYPTGEITTILSTEFDPDASLLHKEFRGLVHLGDVEYHTFVYCTYNRRSQSMSIAVWFLPFDVSCWIITAVLFCLFFLLQIINPGRLYTPQFISETLLVIFRILFRQSLSNPTGLSMLFVVFLLIFSLCYENFITSSLISPSKEIPFENITEAVNAEFILAVEEGTGTSYFKGKDAFFKENKNALRRFDVFEKVSGPSGHQLINSPFNYRAAQARSFINGIDNDLFPDNKKRIYFLRLRIHSNKYFSLISDVKYPYKCLQTKEGLGAFSVYLVSRSGIKGQLAPVFEWIQAAGLWIPFDNLEGCRREIIRRNVWNELVGLKGQGASRLQENLVTLSNIVPLFVASALACIVAVCIFVFECKGQQWRALLTIFLTQTRLGLIKVGD